MRAPYILSQPPAPVGETYLWNGAPSREVYQLTQPLPASFNPREGDQVDLIAPLQGRCEPAVSVYTVGIGDVANAHRLPGQMSHEAEPVARENAQNRRFARYDLGFSPCTGRYADTLDIRRS
jgi:hypothetical protein